MGYLEILRDDWIRGWLERWWNGWMLDYDVANGCHSRDVWKKDGWMEWRSTGMMGRYTFYWFTGWRGGHIE